MLKAGWLLGSDRNRFLSADVNLLRLFQVLETQMTTETDTWRWLSTEYRPAMATGIQSIAAADDLPCASSRAWIMRNHSGGIVARSMLAG